MVILIAQIVSLLALVSLVFLGSIQQWLICFTMYFLMTCVGGTVTFHRLVSHRSWNAAKWFWILGSILGSLGWSGSPLAWAAIHREHHAFTDTDKDPHSPAFQGPLKVQLLSMLHKPKMKFVTDLLRMRHQVFIHRYYLLINLAFDLCLYLIDPFAIIYAHLAPAALTWHAGNGINSLAHEHTKVSVVSRDKPDLSRNIPLLGFLVFGEGWHQNHHERPQSPNFSKSKWQIDIGYWCIRLLQRKPGLKEN